MWCAHIHVLCVPNTIATHCRPIVCKWISYLLLHVLWCLFALRMHWFDQIFRLLRILYMCIRTAVRYWWLHRKHSIRLIKFSGKSLAKTKWFHFIFIDWTEGLKKKKITTTIAIKTRRATKSKMSISRNGWFGW